MATSQVSKIRTEQLSHSLGSGSASTEDSLADITTLEVSNFSLDSPSQGRRDFPSLTNLSKKQGKQDYRTGRRRGEREPRGFRTKKINPRDYSIKFDLEDYLHKDKIKEIMNLESLEESLDEVLTISSSEIDEMFNCRRSSGNSLSLAIDILRWIFQGGDISQSLLASLQNTVSKDDIPTHLKRTEYDALLAVPELEQVGTVADEDMERMMKISQEMLDCDLNQADLDCLLNVDIFTEKQSPTFSLSTSIV